MNKKQLYQRVTKTTGIHQAQVRIILDQYFAEVKQEISSGGKVSVAEFGTFCIKKRAQRKARNVKRNTTLIIPAHYTPIFKASPKLLRLVKQLKKVRVTELQD